MSRSDRVAQMLVLAAAFALAVMIVLAMPASPASAGTDLSVQSVDVADYPRVRLGLTLPPDLAADKGLTFEVRESGRVVSGVKASAVGESREPVSVVLALDVSGSMAGAPLEDAGAAARAFLDSLAEGDSGAIVTFASDARCAAAFGSSEYDLATSLSRLQPVGETALYDGLALAGKQFASAPPGRRVVVLLSDGGDTVSVNGLDAAVAGLKAAGATVYAVALTSPEFDPSVLRTVAGQTGGRFIPVGESAALEALYEDLAREIRTVWSVEYTSPESAGKDVDLDVRVGTASGKEAVFGGVYDNPVFSVPPKETLTVPRQPAWQGALALLVAVLATAGAMALLASLLLEALKTKPRAIRQVRYYDQLRDAAPLSGEEDADPDSIKSRMVDAVGEVAGRRGVVKALHLKLERAGLPLRAPEYIFFHVLGVLAAGLIAQLAFGKTAVTVLVIVTAALGPLAVLEFLVLRRRKAFEAQLPDVLNLISGSLRSGYGLMQAVGLVVDESRDPIAAEFLRAQTEMRLGLPMESALGKVADRVGSEDFTWTVSAICVQREVGGNLAEVLDIVAHTIRERETLRRQVKSLSAEGRLSATILFALPFVEIALLVTVNPTYVSTMTGHPIGIAMGAVGLLLLLLGGVWLRSVIRIEV